MTPLELLAPARNAEIGIAAIDCGADAVYIAGPSFGARKDAGNPVESLSPLCEYAHKFGARIFVTFNVAVSDSELPELHSQMLQAQEAGADAFIIRDPRTALWDDIRIPLHASTQCAIRTPEDAARMKANGCSRVILERELSLAQIRRICSSTDCEIECFVHGALCVCYSGQCRLSEYIDGRSADRGECIQACRSLYDLVDDRGDVLVRNKALLSLKDYNLINRLEDLADAGVISFKIEGRLKNASYVRNITRAYSEALDELVRRHPERWCRASYGTVTAAFSPDPDKTFNRGYTELFIDGERGRWASMDAPKSMGEPVGKVERTDVLPNGNMEIVLEASGKTRELRNGDGFAFITGNAIEGFRGDVCDGRKIICRKLSGIRKGTLLYRNLSSAFEKELDKGCRRELRLALDVSIGNDLSIGVNAVCEDGRTVSRRFPSPGIEAGNRERAEAMIREGLSKRTDHFICNVGSFRSDGPLPFVSASFVNSLRRELAGAVSSLPVPSRIPSGTRTVPDSITPENKGRSGELMRSKYCIRYELGLCPSKQGASATGNLFLTNNGRRFPLKFDCGNCEMAVLTPEQK